MSLRTYLDTLDRFAALVQSMRKPRKPRRIKRRAPRTVAHPAPYLAPAPVVLSDVLRESVAEGLITEAEAWSLANRLEAA